MSLLQEINTAAKKYVPPEIPLVEMTPMALMMISAIDEASTDKKKDTPKKEKKLSDYLKMKPKEQE